MKTLLQKYTYYLSILLLGAIFGMILKSSQAWIEPSDSESTAAPIHTGLTGQSKLGGLILNTDGATAGLIIEKGLVGIGTTNPQGILDITSSNSALLPPRMTTIQRNAIGAPQLGMIIMNTDTKKMNLNDGSTWGEIGGGDTTYGIKTIYTGGSGNTGEYHCKKATVSGAGQQGAWVNINEGLVCNSGKKCISGSCIIPVFVCGSSQVTDAENNSYDTVLINDQCWLKQNLKIGTKLASASTMPTNNSIIEKWCYNNDDANCTTYGGLYQWNEAMQYSTVEGSQGICPTGWHIPTDAQQYALENYLKDTGQTCDANRVNSGSVSGDCSTAGTKLKSGGTPGFVGLLSGFRLSFGGSFATGGIDAYFWSSSQSGLNAWTRYLNSSVATVGRGLFGKALGFSVRCLKN